MPNQDVVAEFRRARDQWDALGQALAPLAERLAFQTVADLLPGAAVIEVRGEVNEDWLRILRIRRVLSGEGDVLFDLTVGHDDPRVEDAIDEANADYLDLLLDLTGDLYMGNHTLEPELNGS
jgi:polysaccharide pyruvyl transferase WcaK-like protein